MLVSKYFWHVQIPFREHCCHCHQTIFLSQSIQISTCSNNRLAHVNIFAYLCDSNLPFLWMQFWLSNFSKKFSVMDNINILVLVCSLLLWTVKYSYYTFNIEWVEITVAKSLYGSNAVYIYDTFQTFPNPSW